MTFAFEIDITVFMILTTFIGTFTESRGNEVRIYIMFKFGHIIAINPLRKRLRMRLITNWVVRALSKPSPNISSRTSSVLDRTYCGKSINWTK